MLIGEHSAHSIPLPVGFRTWFWRYTCLLMLISMLWHRQAIFESKGDKLSSSLCTPFTITLIVFYFIMIFIMIDVTIKGNFVAILFILNYRVRLSVTKWFWFCKCRTPWMFPPLDILEYCIEHVTFGLLYAMFISPTRIFYRGVPGFATDCPCGVWRRGLTICPLYVGPLFGNLV